MIMTENQRPIPKRPIILLPSRLASTRLPNKPLADIHGMPMIVHVMRRAEAADLGPVVVACADREIADVVQSIGGHAILTDPDHPSGSDRIYEALCRFDTDDRYDCVLNVQGDLPTVEPETIRAVYELLQLGWVDVSTAVAEITSPSERADPSVVKAVIEWESGRQAGRALYFSRAVVPANEGPHYHHIGLYGFRREALTRFVALPPSQVELREKLEQLRLLSNGISIAAALVNEVPLGVDTAAQLALAREILAPQKA